MWHSCDKFWYTEVAVFEDMTNRFSLHQTFSSEDFLKWPLEKNLPYCIAVKCIWSFALSLYKDVSVKWLCSSLSQILVLFFFPFYFFTHEVFLERCVVQSARCWAVLLQLTLENIGLYCVGPLICRLFQYIYWKSFWRFVPIWKLFSSMLYCKNIVYNTYNIQNMC